MAINCVVLAWTRAKTWRKLKAYDVTASLNLTKSKIIKPRLSFTKPSLILYHVPKIIKDVLNEYLRDQSFIKPMLVVLSELSIAN